MSSNSEDDGTRERLKVTAMRLFARHGIDGVSIRSILTEAGVKNSAGIHYYFRTKDDLIRELVVDALRRTRRARHAALDALETEKSEISVRDIVDVIVRVETIGTGDPEQIKEPPIGFGHMRFISALQLNHRDKFMAAVGDEGDPSFQRCIDHIVKALPVVPRAVLNQRIAFFYQFAQASLSAREAAFVAAASGGRLWGQADALTNLIDSLTASLTGP